MGNCTLHKQKKNIFNHLQWPHNSYASHAVTCFGCHLSVPFPASTHGSTLSARLPCICGIILDPKEPDASNSQPQNPKAPATAIFLTNRSWPQTCWVMGALGCCYIIYPESVSNNLKPNFKSNFMPMLVNFQIVIVMAFFFKDVCTSVNLLKCKADVGTCTGTTRKNQPIYSNYNCHQKTLLYWSREEGMFFHGKYAIKCDPCHSLKWFAHHSFRALLELPNLCFQNWFHSVSHSISSLKREGRWSGTNVFCILQTLQ